MSTYCPVKRSQGSKNFRGRRERQQQVREAEDTKCFKKQDVDEFTLKKTSLSSLLHTFVLKDISLSSLSHLFLQLSHLFLQLAHTEKILERKHLAPDFFKNLAISNGTPKIQQLIMADVKFTEICVKLYCIRKRFELIFSDVQDLEMNQSARKHIRNTTKKKGCQTCVAKSAQHQTTLVTIQQERMHVQARMRTQVYTSYRKANFQHDFLPSPNESGLAFSPFHEAKPRGNCVTL